MKKLSRKKIPIFLTPLQTRMILKFLEDFEREFKEYYSHPYLIESHFRNRIKYESN